MVVVVPGLVRTATALGKWVVRKWWNSDAFRHKYFSHPYEQEGMTRGLLKDPELGLLKDHITVLDWKNLNPSAGQTFRHIGKADAAKRLPFFREQIELLGLDAAGFASAVDAIVADGLVTPNVTEIEASIYWADEPPMPAATPNLLFKHGPAPRC